MHSAIDRIPEALQFIDASDREAWLHMGMSIKCELGTDTAGLVIAPEQENMALIERIPATEWQAHIRTAIDAGMIFVGAGRPDIPNGTGIYALVRDAHTLPAAITIAQQRVGEVSRYGTAWMVFATGDIRRIAYDTLAQIMPTEGRA